MLSSTFVVVLSLLIGLCLGALITLSLMEKSHNNVSKATDAYIEYLENENDKLRERGQPCPKKTP